MTGSHAISMCNNPLNRLIVVAAVIVKWIMYKRKLRQTRKGGREEGREGIGEGGREEEREEGRREEGRLIKQLSWSYS
jgi:hypothetical protein